MPNQQKMRIRIGYFLKWSTSLFMLFFAHYALAVDYVFPSRMPSGCSNQGGGVYSCGNVTLGWNDTITIIGRRPATININGNLVTSNAKINLSNSASDLTINVTGSVVADYQANINANLSANSVTDSGSGTVTFGGNITTSTGGVSFRGSENNIAGSVTSTSGNIRFGVRNVIQGNVSSTAGSITLDFRGFIAGNVSGGGEINIGNAARVGGNIVGNTGNVFVDFAGQVIGSTTTSSGTIRFSQSTIAGGCVSSTQSASIRLDYQANIHSVCCGSACNTSCVRNDTTYSMPPRCTGSSVLPSNFNCVMVGGNPASGTLDTQIANTRFSIDVVALKSDGSIETSYGSDGTKNITLEFVDGSGTTSCGGRTVLNPAVSQTVAFTSSDLGRKTVSNISISKAYRDLRCRVTDANQSSSIVGCSSDNFAVRPTGFNVTSSNANADNLGANITATPAIKAGVSFNLTASAGVQGYDGIPIIDVSKINAHSGAVRLGNLNGSFSSANSSTGIASGESFNYNEVGYFRLLSQGVYDSTFTAVDAVNGGCVAGFTSSGGKYGCSFGNTTATNYFGRFIPDHFAITSGDNIPACSSAFTYFGQDGLSTAFTLSAQNTGNTTTQNYTGTYAKLGVNTWANFNFTASVLPTGSLLSASATAPTGNWASGIANVVARHLVSRPTQATGPTNITISTAPVDADGVTMPITAVATASPFRFGRLFAANSYGSELLPLSVPIEAQYWNGMTYQRNQLDNCTVIPANTIQMGNYRANLNACETQLIGAGSMSNGKANMNLSRPGAGNSGSVELSINLNAAAGSTCNSATASAAGSASAPWFGNTNPSARATFGIYKSPVIYLRENF